MAAVTTGRVCITSLDPGQDLMQQAAFALERRDFAQAHLLFSQSIESFRIRGLKRQEADALRALAQVLMAASDFTSALEAYTDSIALYRKLNCRGQLAVTLRDAGYACSDRGEVSKALELLCESFRLFEATADREGAASALEGLGIVALDRRDLDEARLYFERSLIIHRGLELNPESAVSLIYLSITALAAADIDMAAIHYHESIDCFRQHHAESSLVSPLLTVGEVAFATRDSIQISELLQAALAVYGASRLKRSWDSAMSRLGGVAQQRHVNQARLEAYRHTFSVDPARDEWGSEAIACLGLGCVAYRQDRPNTGKELIARSLNLCRQNGDSDTVLYVLAYAAAFTYQSQHFADSQYFHTQCAAAARSAGDILQAADATCYAGFLASWCGEYEEARRCGVEALGVYRFQGMQTDIARAQSLIGSALCQLGEAEIGLRIHDEAIHLCRETCDSACTALALASKGASLTRIDLAEARRFLQESVDLVDGCHTSIEQEINQHVAELERLSGNADAAYEILCSDLDSRALDADRYSAATDLLGCGLIAEQAQLYRHAAIMLAKARAIRDCIGTPLTVKAKIEEETAMAAIKSYLGSVVFDLITEEAASAGLQCASATAREIREIVRSGYHLTR